MLLTARPSGQLMQLALLAAVYLPAPQLIQAPAAALPEAATNLPVAQLLHSPSAGAALYFPGMQLLQMAAPVSTACSPVSELWLAVYFPEGQSMHVAILITSLYVPIAQSLQRTAPALTSCPPAVELWLAAYFPAIQSMQADSEELPVPLTTRPSGQLMQSARLLAVYLPALQTMQALVSVLPAAATCLPSGQASHVPVSVPYFPAAHGVQPVDAGCKDAA